MGCGGCDPGYPFDSRTYAVPVSNAALGPVLGPYLGGGVVGTGLGAGNIAKVGGGLAPLAVHQAESSDPVEYPAVRHDFRFDFSTPVMIFQRDRFIDPSLNRELGGMLGGYVGNL